jgi:hypothetical protein
LSFADFFAARGRASAGPNAALGFSREIDEGERGVESAFDSIQTLEEPPKISSRFG